MKKQITSILSAALMGSLSVLNAQTITVTEPQKPVAPVAPKASYTLTTRAMAPKQITLNGQPFDNENEFKDLKSKEVSQEINTPKNVDVFIENTNRPIEVKIWDQPKIKVVTTIYYEGDADKLSDAEWFEKLNINLKTLGNSVRIKSGTVGGGSYTYGGQTWNWNTGGNEGNVAIFNEKGENIGSKSNIKRVVTIYLPKENRLDIESKYADLTLTSNIAKATIDITNGSLDAQDINTLLLRSKYANVSLGNVKLAEIEFINGRFIAKDVEEADIDTKYSNVEIASVKKLNLRSTNDEYEIEELASLQGRKNYGNLRINKLTGSFELDGTNADVKIRNISSSTQLIKIDDKYADLRLPLREVKNFDINFSGPYSTVYGNFERKPWQPVDPKTDKQTTNKEENNGNDLKELRALKALRAIGSVQIDDENANYRFTATGGTGKGTQIVLKCQNCTVDFK